jgi:hypothetical protein
LTRLFNQANIFSINFKSEAMSQDIPSHEEINQIPQNEFMELVLNNARDKFSTALIPNKPTKPKAAITEDMIAEFNNLEEEKNRVSKLGIVSQLLSKTRPLNRNDQNLHIQWLQYDAVIGKVNRVIENFGREIFIPGMLNKDELEKKAAEYFTKKTRTFDSFDPHSRIRSALDFGILHAEILLSTKEEDLFYEIFPEIEDNNFFNTDIAKLCNAADNFFCITKDPMETVRFSMQEARKAWGNFTLEDIVLFDYLLDFGINTLRDMCNTQLQKVGKTEPVNPLNLSEALQLVKEAFERGEYGEM